MVMDPAWAPPPTYRKRNMRMKKLDRALYAIIAITLALFIYLFATVANSQAQSYSACTSNTYLHAECAAALTKNFWNTGLHGGTNYTWDYWYKYKRFNDNRVDILGKGWRNGNYGCKWAIVRGDDLSKYVYWHPDATWISGCGGV